ncbi:protease modulator HflC [Luteolibacter sp. AS25]|uniref:protease modulator HflC n=1 Tax=Luteolibacter sp. AS25 TaxID=3135776 RepID=UPI00398B862B
MKRSIIPLFFIAIAVIFFIFSVCSFTIAPTEQVILTQFGDPKGDPITEPGLHFKAPFITVVNRIPKNILPWDGLRNEMPTKDKLYISVDTFGRWRITDPLEYFRRLRNERSANSRLEDILGSETRNTIAKHNLIEIIRTDKDRKPIKDEALEELTDGQSSNIGVLLPIRKGRSALESEIMAAAKSKLEPFGIELLDVRFKRINYNQSVVTKIYERMISERQQIASKFRSEGEGQAARILGDKERDLNGISSQAYKEVQTIKGQADAKASQIYARAYGQNPKAAELYEFIKTMEMYRNTIGKQTSLVLSTDSDLFKFMKSSDAPALEKPEPATFGPQ